MYDSSKERKPETAYEYYRFPCSKIQKDPIGATVEELRLKKLKKLYIWTQEFDFDLVSKSFGWHTL